MVKRAALALEIYEKAKEITALSEKLVYEQHLQQQGWSAVIANMEDLIDMFRNRYTTFYNDFSNHITRRTEYLDFLKSFDDDLNHLSNMPILPGLLTAAQEEFRGFNDLFDEPGSLVFSYTEPNEYRRSRLYSDQEMSDVKSETNEGNKLTNCTILQWIRMKDTQISIRDMAVSCTKGLEMFSQENIDKLKKEVDDGLMLANNMDMKDIKGLDERLHGLDRLMFECQKKVQDQNELSTAFQQNQNRASNIGDESILPDLCESHSSQLSVMLKNHLHIHDIFSRIAKSKEELANNLIYRLRYIITAENKLSELDNRLMFYNRGLKRIERHLIIIEQIHRAPSLYINAVNEVVRRRTFSNAFLMVWFVSTLL